jgi:hypothetical protein
MWITAAGQNVTIDGLTINSDGRGIKIDEQYVNESLAHVTLKVSNATFKTAKKAAILVKSAAGAHITLNNANIANVAEDHGFAVWVDEDAAAYADKVVVNGGLCKVEGVAIKAAATADELVEALAAGDVILTDDVKIEPASMSNAYGKTGINVEAGQTIDGNGYVLDIAGAGGTWDSGICAAGGEIKNITVTGSFRGIFIKGNTEKVILENVTTTGTTYTISCDSGSGAGLAATNCTFKGWTSYAKTIGEVYFLNCSFGAGSGYNYSRPYANTTYENCAFEAGHIVNVRADVVFINCTLGGVLLTSENIDSLVSVTSGSVTVK